MSSAIGRNPVSEAPAAAPMIADSEIGVSIIRSAPNSVYSPAVSPITPPDFSPSPPDPPRPPATSSPNKITFGSNRISTLMASVIASRKVIFVISNYLNNFRKHFLLRMIRVAQEN